MDQFTCEKNKSTKKSFLNVTVTTILTQVLKAAYTAQIMKSSIRNFFSKYDQIRRKLRIWSHLLKKSLMKIFIFCAVIYSTLLRITDQTKNLNLEITADQPLWIKAYVIVNTKNCLNCSATWWISV